MEREIVRLRNLRQKAPENREDYLENQADMAELKGQISRTNCIRGIIRAEDIRRMFGHIHFSPKEQMGGDLTQVQYPTNQKWKKTSSPEELEQRIIEQQGQHSAQANETPVAKATQGNMDLTAMLYHNIMTNSIPDTKK